MVGSKFNLTILVMSILLLSSCLKENMDTFGSYYIYMSKDTASINLKDTLYISNTDTLAKDLVLNNLGVTRSGLRSTYPRIGVDLLVRPDYLDSLVAIYNNSTIPNAAKSDKVLFVGNAVLLPENCYSLNKTCFIENNKFTGPVNLTLHLKQIAALTKGTTYVIPIYLANSTSTSDTIKTNKRYSILKIRRNLNFKKL